MGQYDPTSSGTSSNTATNIKKQKLKIKSLFRNINKPAVAAVLPVPVGLPYASDLAWDDYGAVSFPVAYWDPFPFVVDHPVRSVLLDLLGLQVHPWDLPADIPFPCPCSVHLVASVAR